MQRGVIILFIRFHRLGSDKLKHVCQKKKKKNKPWLFFFPPAFLDTLNVSTNGKFCFWATECQSDSLTVPNPPVTRRAAITLTTTVIEPQPVTVPPACFLVGSTIKRWCSALLVLCLCRLEEAGLAVRDAWVQQDWVCFAELGFSFRGKETARVAFGNLVTAKHKHRDLPASIFELKSHRLFFKLWKHWKLAL